jgi:hypothetical protein
MAAVSSGVFPVLNTRRTQKEKNTSPPPLPLGVEEHLGKTTLLSSVPNSAEGKQHPGKAVIVECVDEDSWG